MLILAIFNTKRTVTPKIGKEELRFVYSESCLIVLHICVKYRENIEWTRVHSRNGYFHYLVCSKSRNSKSRLTRVTGFVFCTLSYGVLQFCEKFHIYILIFRTVFNLKSRHDYTVEMSTFNDQMAITLKIGKAELQFICSVGPLTVLYIYLKFRETTGC